MKAFQLMEEMKGSQKNLLDIISFGRDLYCKNHGTSDIHLWPKTWLSCVTILKDFGYKEPLTYYICLNESHPYLWSIMHNSTELCKHCHQPGSIEFHYLPLADKVKRWCSIPEFCHKISAHWQQKQKWLHGHMPDIHSFREIWDGERFSELSWFWDPDQEWMLPVRCGICSKIISAQELMQQNIAPLETKSVLCPHCLTHLITLYNAPMEIHVT